MPSSSSSSSQIPSTSFTCNTTLFLTHHRHKFTTTLFFIFSLLYSIIKSLSFSLISMDDLDTPADDFLTTADSSSSPAAATTTSAAIPISFIDDDDDDDLLFSHARRRRRLSLPSSSLLSLRHDRLFFVPLKWWRDAEVSDEVKGVCFTTISADNDEINDEGWISNEIVLRLKKRGGLYDGDGEGENSGDDKGEGVSGREYALITESMWFMALKWHSDSWLSRIKDMGCSLPAEDYNMHEVFPLKIRVSVLLESQSLLVLISPKDNFLFHYERACQIFDVERGSVCIWDFSGQMIQFFEADSAMLSNGFLDRAADEVLLELQVYGLTLYGEDKQLRKQEKAFPEYSFNGSFSSSCSTKMNVTAEDDRPSSPSTPLESFDRASGAPILGLTGLVNLGNTCFMNSAIQCLAHTPELVDYFLGDFKKEINSENPLGMRGELALSFGDLLRKLWVPGGMPVAPKLFKSTLENFAPQFSGYNQHDSQELLAFLLDGLHEDLNRVKQKPYIEARDAEGRPDDLVADEFWQNHLARNSSIIVDMCHGQYRSTLVCPNCRQVSVTFDPFMYLSLPLPSTTMRTMTVTIVSTDGRCSLLSITVTVPKVGSCKDLIQALSTACSLRDDETLLVAEVYNNSILRFLEDPLDSVGLIRDDDLLVAYRLPSEGDGSQLVVFMHEQDEWSFGYGISRSCWKLFGIPLVSRIANLVNGYQLLVEYVKLLSPVLKMDVDDFDDIDQSQMGSAKTEATISSSDDSLSSDGEAGPHLRLSSDFQFHFTDERNILRGCRINLSKPLNVSGNPEKLNVLVSWSEEMVRRYDISRFSSLPEVFRPGCFSAKRQEPVTLEKCLEGFLKEEPLGPEDMWYCPSCKQHQQASKKLDLWRLPEILVIHLKRFSYSRFFKNKLETYVDFPIDQLDLSGFLAHQNSPHRDHYRLFAISNHYGGMGGGHYTAVAHHGSRWYEFNDSLVEPIRDDEVKSSAAYVLFYRRISNT